MQVFLRFFFFFNNFFFLLKSFFFNLFLQQDENVIKSNNKKNNYINQLLRLPLLKYRHAHTEKKIHMIKKQIKRKAVPSSLPSKKKYPSPQRFQGSYNPGHNVLELYNILVQIRFTTSKRKLDIQYSKLGIRVASRVAERLKTQDLRKLGNIRKISNLGGHIAQCLVSLQELRL